MVQPRRGARAALRRLHRRPRYLRPNLLGWPHHLIFPASIRVTERQRAPACMYEVTGMEHSYWLGRKRVSGANARSATTAQARLAHLELAGRYSVKADTAAAGEPLPAPAPDLPGSSDYYHQLETGARWLASQAVGRDERVEHLGMADRYARLRLDNSQPVRR